MWLNLKAYIGILGKQKGFWLRVQVSWIYSKIQIRAAFGTHCGIRNSCSLKYAKQTSRYQLCIHCWRIFFGVSWFEINRLGLNFSESNMYYFPWQNKNNETSWNVVWSLKHDFQSPRNILGTSRRLPNRQQNYKEINFTLQKQRYGQWCYFNIEQIFRGQLDWRRGLGWTLRYLSAEASLLESLVLHGRNNRFESSPVSKQYKVCWNFIFECNSSTELFILIGAFKKILLSCFNSNWQWNKDKWIE